MTCLRRRLHLCVAAWLVIQVAALSAFVPQDCCAAHRAQHEKARHITAAVDHSHHHSMDHATMRHDDHQAAPAPPREGCVMKGTCRGPMSAMIAILSSHGVPPTGAFSIVPDPSSTLAARVAHEHADSLLASPDLPPPRA